MNAVSFVIDASQRYSAVFDDLATLMERMTAFFDKLRVYLTDNTEDAKLNKHLRARVYAVLGHFLEVMAIAHKLTTRHSEKWKLAFKSTVFGEDEGVRVALKQLETKISDVTGTEVSVILQSVSENARNLAHLHEKVDRIAHTTETTAGKVDQIAEASELTVVTVGHIAESSAVTASAVGHLTNAEDRRFEGETEKKEAEAIRKFLRIKDNSQPWQDAQDELSQARTPGTGSWLLDMGVIMRWCQPSEQHIVNVFTLQGNPYYGKSYLCSAVVDHLTTLHKEDSRVHVAYYFFNWDPSEARDSINKALKAVFWQFAQGDKQICREFRKLLSKAAGRKTDISKSKDLWDSLVKTHSADLEGTLYVVIDGINGPDPEEGQPVAALVANLMSEAAADSSFEVRVLLSGRPEGLRYLHDTLDPQPPSINLTSSRPTAPNHSDIDLYTRQRLEEMAKFRDPAFEDVKIDIREALVEGVKGDYYTLDSKLKEVEQARLPSQLKAILERANEDRTKVIQRDIDRLEHELAKEEIQEANEILEWTLCARLPLRMEDLEAILSINRTPNTFVSLRQQITERYGALFVVEENDNGGVYVRIGSYEIANLVGDIQPAGIDPAEIALVERTIKTHLDRTFGDGSDLFEKYGFSDFFKSKSRLVAPKTVIRYDGLLAHARVALQCLLALCDRIGDPDFASFQGYAFEWFPDHLMLQMDTSDATPDLAKAITRKLIRFCYGPHDIHMRLHQWIAHRSVWVSRAQSAMILYDWIHSTNIDAALEDMPAERVWIRSLDARNAHSIELLERVAAAVAYACYHEADIDGDLAFRWIRAYLFVLDGDDDKASRAVNTDDLPTLEQIEEVERWTRLALPDCTDEAQWNYLSAKILDVNKFYKEAFVRVEAALALQADKWQARFLWCGLLNALDRSKEAADAFSKLIEDMRPQVDVDDEVTHSFYFDMLPSLSNTYLSLEMYSPAEKISEEVLARSYEKGFERFTRDPVNDMLKIFDRTERYEKALGLVEQLIHEQDGDHSFLALVLHNASQELIYGYEKSPIRRYVVQRSDLLICCHTASSQPSSNRWRSPTKSSKSATT